MKVNSLKWEDGWQMTTSPFSALPTYLIPQPLCGLCGMLSFSTSCFFFCHSLSFSVCLPWFVRTQGVVVWGDCGKRQRNKHHIPRRVMSTAPHYQRIVFSFVSVLHTAGLSWGVMRDIYILQIQLKRLCNIHPKTIFFNFWSFHMLPTEYAEFLSLNPYA